LYQTPEIAHLNAGACYIKLGDLDTAEEYIRKTLRFSPEKLAGAVAAGGHQLQARQLRCRQGADEERGPLERSSAEALWLFLRIERRLGDRTAEASLTAQLRRKYPDSPEYQELLKGNFE